MGRYYALLSTHLRLTFSLLSFEALGNWMHESREHGADNMVVFVAATKSDILTRKVTEKEGREWAQAQGFHYHEVRGGG